MELSDHLREMLKELGQAINESISGSGRVHDSIQRIRDEGYNLYMVLDAKVGVNRRESRLTRVRRGAASELTLQDVEEKLAQFPKGTQFALSAAGSVEAEATAIRKLAAARGLVMVTR